MKYSLPLFFTMLTILVLGSCDKKMEDNTCTSVVKAPVSKIEGPTSALLNQEITLTVSFGCFNGCGQFGSFEETTLGNSTTILVNAKYVGCICTQDAPTRKTSYTFKRSQQGVYELKFFQSDNTYITHSIAVN